MKKILVAIVLAVAALFYMYVQKPVTATPVSEVPSGATNPSASATQPAPAPSQAASGYKDGTYTGSVADAFYGPVQVQATIADGALANVTFLQYPKDRSNSFLISNRAMPILTQEAIAAQSANVNIISGATQTSAAFEQSLSVALAAAKS